jgi:hypothetical protein
MYLWKIYMATLAEYTHRYGKKHGSGRASLSLIRPPKNIKEGKLTSLPQAMPDYCKVVGDSIQAYKNYYINEKYYFANWKSREIPEWFHAKDITII